MGKENMEVIDKIFREKFKIILVVKNIIPLCKIKCIILIT